MGLSEAPVFRRVAKSDYACVASAWCPKFFPQVGATNYRKVSVLLEGYRWKVAVVVGWKVAVVMDGKWPWITFGNHRLFN